jgi:hypothetical protein
MNAEVTMLSAREAAKIGAEDGPFYASYFFPRAIRQKTPQFHYDVWDLLSHNRYASVKIFRGGAKTTIARQFASRRIAYGMGHTILFLGKSQEHAVESIIWLQEQVEYNELWSSTFHLRPGNKWTGSDIEIACQGHWHRRLRPWCERQGLSSRHDHR